MRVGSVVWLMGIALVVGSCYYLFEQRGAELEAERVVRAQAIEARQQAFAESTGATMDWVQTAGCGTLDTPLYKMQRAIAGVDRAMFVVRIDEVVLLDNELQLRASQTYGGHCFLFTPLEIHVSITEEQNNRMPTGISDKMAAYLLAIEVDATAPTKVSQYDAEGRYESDGVLVTGRLIDIARREESSG